MEFLEIISVALLIPRLDRIQVKLEENLISCFVEQVISSSLPARN